MRSFKIFILWAGMAGTCFAQTAPEVNFGQTFVPDYTFGETAIKPAQIIGAADWQVQDGELTGKPKTAAGGWLMLEKEHQDLGFRALFHGTEGSETGILFRTEKTEKGFRGVFLSLKQGGVASYRLELDAQGREIKREKLRPGGGIYYRAAPPAKGDEATTARNYPQRPAPPADLPVTRPNTDLRPNDWNQVEVFIEENVIRAFVNDGGEAGAVADGDNALDEYGPVALYVGGSGEVKFRGLAFKDISFRETPKEKISGKFDMQRISDMYYSWGADAADFNRDGHLDIVAGPLIYYGPGFTRHQEIFTAVAVGPSKEFTSTNVQFTYDFNGDGWPDVLTSPSAAVLFINPRGESRRWKSYNILPSVQSEITQFTDIDGDGVPELVYGAEGYMRYAKFDKNDPGKPWKAYTISGKGYALAHGIGTGDINGDGRVDLLNAYGWWEQPPGPLNEDTQWKYHPVAFGRYGRRGSNIGGSLMAVYDVNGDGLNDVVSNLNVHGFGLAWFEQKRKTDGSIDFERHMISDDYSVKSTGGVTFSQAHGATFADVDLDGIPDYIVGKRYFTHLDNMFDPDSYGAPVLYWYRTVRNPKAPGGAEFVPELIHNRSGAGSEITAVDINKDGAVDILTSTNHGTFIFWNKHTVPGKSPKKK